MANTELINRITEFLNYASEDISKKDLTAAISKLYDDMKKPNKKDDKKKREPTAYNLFMKEQMAKLKEEETKENKMTGKEKMSHIASLWKAKKESDSEGENEKDNKSKKKSESK
jgi:hypothetical protein